MDKEMYYTYQRTMEGVMGYGLVYSVLLIHIISAFFVKYSSRFHFSTIQKLLLLSFFFFSFAFIVLSNFFTALIIAIFADFAIWTLSKSSKYVIILISLFSLYSINPDGFNNTLIDFSLQFVPNGKTHERIESMKTTSLESMDSRKGHMRFSINTIKKHPIIGGASEKLFTIDKNISQHSYIMDTIAIYGIPFGVTYIIILYYPFFILYKKCKYYTQSFFVGIICIAFFMLLYRNNLTGHIGYVAFFLIPSICTYIISSFRPIVNKDFYIDINRV